MRADFQTSVRTALQALSRALFRKNEVLPYDGAVPKARRAVCAACPNVRVITVAGEQAQFCGICTCFIPAKAVLRSEHCPEARWPGDVKK